MRHKHLGHHFIQRPYGKYYICETCGQEFENWKRKISNFIFWKWRFYCGRGENFIADLNGLINVMGGLGVLFLIFESRLDWMKGGDMLIGVWAIQKALVFFLGYMDIHYWHIFQNENTMMMQFSPKEIEQFTRLRNIEKIICEKEGKEYNKESILDNLPKK